LREQIAQGSGQVGQRVEHVLRRAGDELTEVRVVKVERAEARKALGLALEALDHFGGRDARSEGRGQHGPGAQSDIGVEFRCLFVDQEVVGRLQAAQLERPSRRRTPSQHQSHLRVALARRKVALLDDGNPHRVPPLGQLP
jgi:hypothetical protein